MMTRLRLRFTEDKTDHFRRKDIDQSRICAALAYLLFFIPVVIQPDCGFGRYHANQSLLLLILSTVGVVVVSMVPRAGPFLGMGLMAFCLICAVRGVVLALTRRANCVPVFGGITIIPYERAA